MKRDLLLSPAPWRMSEIKTGFSITDAVGYRVCHCVRDELTAKLLTAAPALLLFAQSFAGLPCSCGDAETGHLCDGCAARTMLEHRGLEGVRMVSNG